ncbi:signal peptidase I [Desulforhopalus sp. IMCC35007]|uniref:signal peptidase I n=1 Tax=Desulforhopalus sp. IMCC35007 TaxID=2569543 RepID=UPI001F0F2109|nr:signal peptidase I [Desulforhopalus sp. IMCC35007]
MNTSREKTANLGLLNITPIFSDPIMPSSPIRRFFFPALTKRFFLRLLLLSLACYIIFGHILIPLRIQGMSMEPTYQDGSYALCWRLQFLLSPPKRFDVVTVRFSGRRVMLLKRVVALVGETVEFRNGLLYVNGNPVEEPYVHYRSDWQLPQRTVAPGHIYVVGDNRGTPMARHQFGEVNMNRIVGGVLP